jgi:DNA repair exonuclease SbcCD ATPase subunit
MEPFKALTFLAATAVVSLVGAGAGGFYAGYTAGRGNLDEIKAQISNISTGGVSVATLMKPVQEDVRALTKQVQDDVHALSKQVETLNLKPVADPGQATKPVMEEIKGLSRQLEGWRPRPAADQEQAAAVSKPVLEEIKNLARQLETLKVRPQGEPDQGAGKAVLEEIRALSKQVEALKTVRPAAAEPERNGGQQAQQQQALLTEEFKTLSRQIETLKGARPAAEPSEGIKPVLDEIKTVSRQIETLKAGRPGAEPSEGIKPVLDEIKTVSRQIEGLRNLQPARSPDMSTPVTPDYTEALASIREQINTFGTKLDKQQEPKAPKALIDEIRSLSASVQASEPVVRRAITEELRNAVATLQNSEPKVSKALMDELHTISANTRPDPRPQPNVTDQIKVLSASIDGLKAKIAEDGGHSGSASCASAGGGASVAGEVAQIQRLVAQASDQFGKCQMQLASISSAGLGQAHMQATAAAPSAAAPAAVQPGQQTVVFYDNVMLKKDQEKQYDEIGVRLALQSVGPRQVKVAVNRQDFGLAFGERKVFRSQDVQCELNLMETNLNDAQARVSISCKR